MKSPEIVDAWLAIATRDLCPAAKERIALEITAHFDEAVAAHVAEGLPLTEAKLQAWEDLGDAEAARKRFRKRHLTVKEFEFTEKQRKSWQGYPMLRATALGAIATLLLTGWIMPRSVFNFVLCGLLIEIAAAFVSRDAARMTLESLAIKRMGRVAILLLGIELVLSLSALVVFGFVGMWVFNICVFHMVRNCGWLTIVYKSVREKGSEGN